MATYFFRPAPKVESEELRAVVTWVENELRRVALAQTEVSILPMEVLHVEPTKRREGMVAWADGTNWNPGSGAGPYAYIGAAWTRLKP